jgi:hypothetical protein
VENLVNQGTGPNKLISIAKVKSFVLCIDFFVIRPPFEVVKVGRISIKIRHLQDQLQVFFCKVPVSLTQNQEVTTSKIVTFFWCQFGVRI